MFIQSNFMVHFYKIEAKKKNIQIIFLNRDNNRSCQYNNRQSGQLTLKPQENCQTLKNYNLIDNNQQCISCQSGFFLDEDSYLCKKCLQENCQFCQNTSQCIECQLGYLLVNNGKQCQQCSVSNCKDCNSDSSKCQICYNGYLLSADANKCVLSQSCSQGYYFSQQSQKCIQCSQNCIKCLDESTCSECISSIYKIKNNQCVLDCSSDCDECEFSQFLNKIACIKCKSITQSGELQYYDFVQNKCVSCSQNCKSCISSYNVYLRNDEYIQNFFLQNLDSQLDQNEIELQKQNLAKQKPIICLECQQDYQYDINFDLCGKCQNPSFLCDRRVEIKKEIDCSDSIDIISLKLEQNISDQFVKDFVNQIYIQILFKDKKCTLQQNLMITNDIYKFIPKSEIIIEIKDSQIDLNGQNLSISQFDQIIITNTVIKNNSARYKSIVLFEGINSDSTIIKKSKVSLQGVDFITCFCEQKYSIINEINIQKVTIDNSKMVAYQLFNFIGSNSLFEFIIDDLQIKNHYFYNDITLFNIAKVKMFFNQKIVIKLQNIKLINCQIVDSSLIYIDNNYKRIQQILIQNIQLADSSLLRSNLIKSLSDLEINNLQIANTLIIASQIVVIIDSSIIFAETSIDIKQNFINSLLVNLNSIRYTKQNDQEYKIVQIQNVKFNMNQEINYSVIQINGYKQLLIDNLTISIIQFDKSNINLNLSQLIFDYQQNQQYYSVKSSNLNVLYTNQPYQQIIKIINTNEISMNTIQVSSTIDTITENISNLPSIFYIYTSNSIEIKNSQFNKNKFFIIHLIDQQQTFFESCKFIQNYATIILSEQKQLLKQLGNIKLKSTDIMQNTLPKDLNSFIISQNDQIKLETCNFDKNQILDNQFTVLIYINQNKIISSQIVSIYFVGSSDTLFYNQQQFLRIQGNISSSQVEFTGKNVTDLILNKIVVTGCQPGEFYNKNTLKCEVCGFGTYSLTYDSEECIQCPPDCSCSGGMNIELHSGFWRENIYSDNIAKCDEIISHEICVGGPTNKTCKEGFIGALCQSCDLFGTQWGDSYFNPNNSYEYCETCQGSLKGVVLKAVFITLFFMASMYWSITKNMYIVLVKITQTHMNSLGFLSRGIDQPSYIIKIFNHYIQITGIISSFKLSSFSDLTSLFDFLGSPMDFVGSSVDCILKDNEYNIPYIYLKVIFSTFYFFFLILMFFFAFMGLKMFKLTSYKFHHVLCTTLTYTFIILQPTIVNMLFKLLACRGVAGKQYMTYYMDQECWSDEHFKYSWAFTFPLCLLLIVIIPGLLIRMLYVNKKRDKLNSVDIRFSYGILYNEYTDEMSFWEIIKIFQKIIIISVTQIFGEKHVLKGISVILFLFSYAVLQIKYQPYQTPMLNKLDLQQTIISCVTILTALLLKQSSDITIMIMGLSFISIINGYLFLVIFRYLLMGYTQIFEIKIEQFKEYIISKFPKASRYITLKRQQILNTRKYWGVLRKHFKNFVTLKREGKFVTAQVITNHAYLENQNIFNLIVHQCLINLSRIKTKVIKYLQKHLSSINQLKDMKERLLL